MTPRGGKTKQPTEELMNAQGNESYTAGVSTACPDTDLSVRQQCQLLSLNRSTLYYKAKPAFDDTDSADRIEFYVIL